MGVRLSYDNGKSWSKSKVVWAGPAAYGDLASIGDNSAIMIFENGDTGFAQRVSYIYTAASSSLLPGSKLSQNSGLYLMLTMPHLIQKYADKKVASVVPLVIMALMFVVII